MINVSLKHGMIIAVLMFAVFSIFMFVQHEISLLQHKDNSHPHTGGKPKLTRKDFTAGKSDKLRKAVEKLGGGLGGSLHVDENPDAIKPTIPPVKILDTPKDKSIAKPAVLKPDPVVTNPVTAIPVKKPEPPSKPHVPSVVHAEATPLPSLFELNTNLSTQHVPLAEIERKGVLMCNGKSVDSEVIYWKDVPEDNEYESPITPHHGLHHDRYLSFEYDQGGWNNVRMGMECLIVVAHAMGRTLVIPPQQHLYLLGKTHKDAHDKEAHDEMGFEDFFDIGLLRTHKGFHVMHMEEFLAKEGVTGGLHGVLPPDNSTQAWGQKLWGYLAKVADEKPAWMGRFIAFPDSAGDFNLSSVYHGNKTRALNRLKEFGGDRSPVFYEDNLQVAHHIHFQAGPNHRVLQHHYAFTYFADPAMQSFYRRFVRDYMRYKDNIQCAGSELLAAVRADALKINPASGGDFYALHIRRGDFQFKDVKISADEIVKNLHLANGTSIIPPGSLVYLSTDDPDGICKDCFVNRQPCTSYKTPKPVGCPEDTTWNAMTNAGWKIRFLRDYLNDGHLKDVNPNVHGMVESIVCSRAKVFAGTYFSTFTGYIHRLRGYHGLGEATYYHSARYLMHPQMKKSIGHGFSREWRAGWTDDGGELI